MAGFRDGRDMIDTTPHASGGLSAIHTVIAAAEEKARLARAYDALSRELRSRLRAIKQLSVRVARGETGLRSQLDTALDEFEAEVDGLSWAIDVLRVPFEELSREPRGSTARRGTSHLATLLRGPRG